jgi:hypothetical protein
MISFACFCARYTKPYWRYETGKTSHHFRFASARSLLKFRLGDLTPSASCVGISLNGGENNLCKT